MKQTRKMFASLGFAISLGAALHVHAQPWYGHQHYPHDSTTLSSAKRTFNSAGYVMAGFRPVRQNSSSSPDFVIDKVSGDGHFSSAADFQTEYQIEADINCTSANYVYNCTGVSIIETNSSGLGEAYAIAGAFDYGVFFATLDNSGAVISQNFWPLNSFGATRKPAIRESAANPGTYYICGNSSLESYVIKVDALGNQQWGNYYKANDTEARDLIESPYNPNELIVVGRTDVTYPLTAADAFFLSLDAGSGAINYFKNYTFDQWGSDDWFTSIEIANSAASGGKGFVLGGRAFGLTGPPVPPYPKNINYTQLMTKLDPAGNILWTTLIEPALSNSISLAGGEIERVIERFNSNTSQYEYYGVAASYYYSDPTIPYENMVVFKLDDNGKATLSPNEFHYSGSIAPPGFPFGFCDITNIETGGGNDDGIQVFATSPTSPSFNGHEVIKAYFNGVSGCNDTLVNIDSTFYGLIYVGLQKITTLPISSCSSFSLNVNAVTSLVSGPCYTTSVPSGSNARTTTGIAAVNAPGAATSIYPNPVSSKATVSVPAFIKDQVTISLFNNLGQKVQDYSYNQGGDYEIDFKSLGVKSGLYFVRVTTGSLKSNYKIIYEAK